MGRTSSCNFSHIEASAVNNVICVSTHAMNCNKINTEMEPPPMLECCPLAPGVITTAPCPHLILAKWSLDTSLFP